MGFFKKLFGSGPEPDESAEDYFNRGNAYAEKGEHDAAIRDFTKAIRLDPHWAVAYNNRGYSYYCKGYRDRAVADYSQVIRLAEKPDAMMYCDRGSAYAGTDKLDKAIADFSEAIRLDPKCADAYQGRGYVYYDAATFKKLRESEPEPLRSQFTITHGGLVSML